MKKIHIVVWTKAQLIKMAPIMKLLQDRNIEYNYIFTGQHQETMWELQKNFWLKDPDIVLYSWKDITWVVQMLFWVFKILWKILFWKKEKVFGQKETKWQILLTHWDTFSTILWALMWKLAWMKVAHVESGLRSFNIFHPFPEELTRLWTFRLSNIYFCPWDWAINNLKKYKWEKINTEYNSLLDALKLAIKNEDKAKVEIPKEDYCVFTTHRFENIFKKEKFEEIISYLEEIQKNIKVLFILHPPTRKQLEKFGLMDKIEKLENVELRPRYDYFDFNKLLYYSQYCVTDGGSNQEECYYMWKPCLLLREATERTEWLDKNVVISKFDKNIISDFIKNYKKYSFDFIQTEKSPSEIIVNYCLNFINKK